MPKLPTAEQLGERPQPHPSANVVPLRTASGQEEAPALAAAAFGEKVQKVVDTEFEKLATTQAEDAWNAYRGAALDLSVGEKGFVQKHGADAVGPKANLFAEYTGQLGTARNFIEEGLTNREAREKFKARADATDIQYKDHLLRHYAQERVAYEQTTFENSLAVNKATVTAAPQDENAYRLASENLRQQYDKLAELKGLKDPIANDVAKKSLNQELIKTRIESLLYKDPIEAKKLLDATREKFTNPQLMDALQRKVTEVMDVVQTKVEGDKAVEESYKAILKPRLSSGGRPGEHPFDIKKQAESLAEINKALKKNPTDPDLLQAKYVVEQGEYEDTDTSGRPNSKAIRAAMPIALGKVEEIATRLFGTDKGAPGRATFVERLDRYMTARIDRDARAANAYESQEVDAMLDIVSGLGASGMVKAGVGRAGAQGDLITSPAQLTPEQLRKFQGMSAQSKIAILRVMEGNAALGRRGDTDLFWDTFRRIHQEPGTPGKIEWSSELATPEMAGPGKLSTEQINVLRHELAVASTENMQSHSQIIQWAKDSARRQIKSSAIAAIPGAAEDAINRWDLMLFQKINEYRSDKKKDFNALFKADGDESIISSEFIKKFIGRTSGQALKEGAEKVIQQSAPIQQPKNIDTPEKLDAWFKTVPPDVLRFIGTDGEKRWIPGRKPGIVPTAAAAQPQPAAPAAAITTESVLAPRNEPPVTAGSAQAARPAPAQDTTDEAGPAFVDQFQKPRKGFRSAEQVKEGAAATSAARVQRASDLAATVAAGFKTWVYNATTPLRVAANGVIQAVEFFTPDEEARALKDFRLLAQQRTARASEDNYVIINNFIASGKGTDAEKAKAQRMAKALATKLGVVIPEGP